MNIDEFHGKTFDELLEFTEKHYPFASITFIGGDGKISIDTGMEIGGKKILIPTEFYEGYFTIDGNKCEEARLLYYREVVIGSAWDSGILSDEQTKNAMLEVQDSYNWRSVLVKYGIIGV